MQKRKSPSGTSTGGNYALIKYIVIFSFAAVHGMQTGELFAFHFLWGFRIQFDHKVAIFDQVDLITLLNYISNFSVASSPADANETISLLYSGESPHRKHANFLYQNKVSVVKSNLASPRLKDIHPKMYWWPMYSTIVNVAYNLVVLS